MMSSRRSRLRLLGILFVIVILLSSNRFRPVFAAGAQMPMANLSGLVTDETKAVVPTTVITVLNTSTGLQRQAVTDDTGYFAIPLLPAGKYTLNAEMPGFATV